MRGVQVQHAPETCEIWPEPRLRQARPSLPPALRESFRNPPPRFATMPDKSEVLSGNHYEIGRMTSNPSPEDMRFGVLSIGNDPRAGTAGGCAPGWEKGSRSA